MSTVEVQDRNIQDRRSRQEFQDGRPREEAQDRRSRMAVRDPSGVIALPLWMARVRSARTSRFALVRELLEAQSSLKRSRPRGQKREVRDTSWIMHFLSAAYRRGLARTSGAVFSPRARAGSVLGCSRRTSPLSADCARAGLPAPRCANACRVGGLRYQRRPRLHTGGRSSRLRPPPI